MSMTAVGSKSTAPLEKVILPHLFQILSRKEWMEGPSTELGFDISKEVPNWVSKSFRFVDVLVGEISIVLMVPRRALPFESVAVAYRMMCQHHCVFFLVVADVLPAKSRGVLARMSIPHITSDRKFFAPGFQNVKLLSGATAVPHLGTTAVLQQQSLLPMAQKLVVAHILNRPFLRNVHTLTHLLAALRGEKQVLSLSTLSRLVDQLVVQGFVRASGMGPQRRFDFIDRNLSWDKLMSLPRVRIARIQQVRLLPPPGDFEWVFSGGTALSFYSDQHRSYETRLAMTAAEYQRWVSTFGAEKIQGVSILNRTSVEIWRSDPTFLATERNLNIIELSLVLRSATNPKLRQAISDSLLAVGLDSNNLWD